MPCNAASMCLFVASALTLVAAQGQEIVYSDSDMDIMDALAYLNAQRLDPEGHFSAKRDMDGTMPGVLRFGKRSLDFDVRENAMQKKQMPGVLRFGKRAYENEKKSVPGVLRFGKRSPPGMLRFGKKDGSDIPGVLRFGKRSVPGVLRFGKRQMPGVLRFGKRAMPGVLRFGKRDSEDSSFEKRSSDLDMSRYIFKKSVPGVLRFGK